MATGARSRLSRGLSAWRDRPAGVRSRIAHELYEWKDEPLRAVRLRAGLQLPYRRLRFASFGRNSVLHRPTWVYGPHRIELGDVVLIMHGARLSAERVGWERGEPQITIGDRVSIGAHCVVSAANSIVLEDGVTIGSFCSIIDSDHKQLATESDSVLNGPLEVEPVRIGRGTWIGDRVAVLRGAQIGRFCSIGANSVVRGEIPDYSVAVGAPARVVGSTRDPASVPVARH